MEIDNHCGIHLVKMSHLPCDIHATIAAYTGPSPAGYLCRFLANKSTVINSVTVNSSKGTITATFRNGSLHSQNDRPALVCGERKEWWNNGVRHRGNDLPAIIDSGHEEWFYNGRLHRMNDAPAIIHHEHCKYKQTLLSKFEVWYVDGRLHRDRAPAVVHTKFLDTDEKKQIILQQWWREGKLHRDGAPAVIRIDRTEQSPVKEWWRDGKKHRDDGPAVVTPTKFEWWVFGHRHRDGHPAVIKFEKRQSHRRAPYDDYGCTCYTCDSERRHKMTHSIKETIPFTEKFITDIFPGPRENLFDFVSDTIVNERKIRVVTQQWWRNGLLHRDGAPAEIKIDHCYLRNTWYKNGRKHRIDGPAICGPDDEWYVNGVMHRDFGLCAYQDQYNLEFSYLGIKYDSFVWD